MTEHDRLVLIAVRRSIVRPAFHDVDVRRAGDGLFGDGWTRTSTSHRSGLQYAPLVAMSLGRLAREGWVTKGQCVRAGRNRYHLWRLTEVGALVGDELIAEYGLDAGARS